MQDRISSKASIVFLIGFLVFVFLCLGYSPLLSSVVIILVLAVFPVNNITLRSCLAILFIISLAFQISSRQLFVSTSDDFSNVYVVVYNNIVTKNMSPFYGPFSGGIEFGIPVLFKLLHGLFGRQTYQELMFCLVMINCFIFYIWLEYFSSKRVSKEQVSFFIAVALFIFSSNVTSQLIRQSFSTCFLLFAITFYREGKKTFWIYLIVAFIFHVTALPFFFLYNIISGNSSKLKNSVALFLFIFTASFLSIISFLYGWGALGSATQKLEYYLSDGAGQQFFIDGLKYVLLNFAVAFLFMDKEKYSLEWSFIKYGFIYYILLIPIPLASERGLLLIVTFLPGVLMYFAFSNYKWLLKIFFTLFVLAKFLKLGFLYKSTPDDVFNLWFYYPWASDTMFYYLKFYNWFLF